MLRRMVVKELMEHLISYRFLVASALCLVMTLAGAVVLSADHTRQLSDHQTAVTQHRRMAAGKGSYAQLGWLGIELDRPVNRLQILATGIERRLPNSVWISDLFDVRYRGDLNRSPMLALFPTCDLVFVAGVIMGLLAMVFGYDSICGEKELGTLRQVLATGVPRDIVLLGKWVGGCLAILIPFLGSAAVGLIALVLLRSTVVGLAGSVAALMVYCVCSLYICAMYTLGMLVSCQTTSTSTSIVVLLLAWVSLALVIPNVSPPLGSLLSPAPTAQSVETAKNKIFREETAAFHREVDAMRRGGAMMNRMEKMFELREILSEARARVDHDFRRRMDRQITVSLGISRVSPLSCLVYAGTALAGTGPGEQGRFVAAVRVYQQEFGRFIRQATEEGFRPTAGELDLQSLPGFDYKIPPVSERLREALVDILLLCAFTAVFFAAAHVSFLKYDIT